MHKIIDRTIKKVLEPLIERLVNYEGFVESNGDRLDNLNARLEAQ